MQTMKAFVRTDATSGNVEIADVPIPAVNDDEVLVQVEAFGVGIHDRYFIPRNVDFPFPIGIEGAGKIVQLGNQVTDFAVGDRVIFTTSFQPKGGSWAEYAAANQATLIPMPDHLTFQQGAAVHVAGKTALESMRALDLNKGDSLFIAGASGAVGTFVIQLAAAKGIHVAGSASARNHDYMTSLGAEKTVDYHDADWQKQVNEWADGGVTAALAIQPGTGKDSLPVVKDGGKVITVSGDQLEGERGITVQQMSHHQDTHKDVIQLVHDIADEKIKLVIEKEYPFEQGLEALKKTETRHARGKLVVTTP
ncbi:NADP-dependent oxidoreductase [Lentibacillus juripiscarius]|uniref:NADP-dependent oxidoreductase n=1 Tax=Lentibacillus juripiscarius TaxID=257446 RepID=A0ABW5V826_9BACI